MEDDALPPGLLSWLLAPEARRLLPACAAAC